MTYNWYRQLYKSRDNIYVSAFKNTKRSERTMLAFLQRIGKSLMLPIAVLPAAALLLRLGQPDLLNIPFVANAGNAIFANLALIFAIGVAIGFSKDGNGAAGLAGAIGYFVLTQGTAAINENINMAVLGGIISGIVAGLLYNRFHTIKLPDWLGFFGGRRFVPIVTAGMMVVLAGLFGVIWPPIQFGINALGEWIIGAGAVGVGAFGFLNRLLIPVGLHHVLNTLVWFEFGEFTNAAGEVIKGDLSRFFAGDKSAGSFMAGFFPIMMFGLPAAGLAMIVTAKKHRRKAVAGLIGGLAFTSFLTGITEPIEFLFMFLSPLLYFVHALLTGISMIVAYMLDIHHGFGFSAGAIDFFLNFGIAQKPLLLFFVGLIFGAVYFFIFVALIKALNLKTPGREEEDEETTGNKEQATGDKYENMAKKYVVALGGVKNIKLIENCATRLRLQIEEMSKVKENVLKSNSSGVVKVNSKNIQIIVGTNVEFVADAMKQIVASGDVTDDDTIDAAQVINESPTQGLKEQDFVMPLEGTVIPLTDVPDEVFSKLMMGEGFAIEPSKGEVVSPVDGEIINVFPSKHAIGIRSKDGYELLIHVGLDTVKLNGEGFKEFVKQGDHVTKGQKLLEFDIESVRTKVPSLITPIVFTNLKRLKLKKTGKVSINESNILSID
jgi:PTS system N-acetylglucosamine-specific IIC component